MSNRIDLDDGEEGYVIYRPKFGFVCEDEDRIGGFGYDYEITEDTIQFSLELARETASGDEIVLKLVDMGNK